MSIAPCMSPESITDTHKPGTPQHYWTLMDSPLELVLSETNLEQAMKLAIGVAETILAIL